MGPRLRGKVREKTKQVQQPEASVLPRSLRSAAWDRRLESFESLERLEQTPEDRRADRAPRDLSNRRGHRSDARTMNVRASRPEQGWAADAAQRHGPPGPGQEGIEPK